MVKTNYNTVLDTTVVSKLASENTKRKELIIVNNSTATLYVAYGRLPSSTDYVASLGAQDTLTTNSQDSVMGVWSSDASGQANIVEAVSDKEVTPTDVTTRIVRSSAVSITANSSVNVAQINGVTTTMGNGASGTGVQRVTLASDSTGNIATIGTSVTPGTAATNLGKAVDSAGGSTDTGVAALAIRDDALSTLTPAEGDYTRLFVDSTGALWTRETMAPAYEDNTNAVAKVEQRFSYTNISADTAVKSGAGFLHTLTFAQIDAAPTAGTIIVYDNTAESGTVIFSSTWTTAVFFPTTVILDVSFSTGLYVGFTTTADIGVTVSYR